jgi:hypothetical protein
MRLIDADALIKTIRLQGMLGDCHSGAEREDDVVDMIESAPTIEPPQGEWLMTIVWDRGIEKEVEEKCSLCGRRVYRYDTQPQDEWCPTCGAKMEGIS